MVVNLGYSGIAGSACWRPNTISTFPKSSLAAALRRDHASSRCSAERRDRRSKPPSPEPTQQIGLLQYDYPYYGRVQVSGLNLGTVKYHAMTVRLERRFSKGLSVLANYTLSRLLDDIGGPDGQGGRRCSRSIRSAPPGTEPSRSHAPAEYRRTCTSSRSVKDGSGWQSELVRVEGAGRSGRRLAGRGQLTVG